MIFTSQPGRGRDFYLSNSGHDTGEGSESAPWSSLTHLAQQHPGPGDRIFLRGGDVFAGPLDLAADPAIPTALQKSLVIASYGKGPARLEVKSGSALTLRNLGNVTVRGLRVVGGGKKSASGSGVAILCDQPAGVRLGAVTLEDMEISGFSNAGILVNVATGGSNSGSGYDGVTIRRCRAYDNARCGILVAGDLREPADGTEKRNFRDVHVEHCEVHDNPGDPDYLENHSGNGILIGSVDTGRIEHCTALRNGALCNNASGGPVGIWAYASRHVVIADCLSAENRTGRSLDGGGFDLDGGCEDCRIENCVSRDNDGAGYLLFHFQGAPFQWRNNVVKGCRSENDGRKGPYGSFIFGGDIDGVEIAGNTARLDQRVSNPKAACIGYIGINEHCRLRLTDNVFITQGHLVTNGTPPLQVVSSNNHYEKE